MRCKNYKGKKFDLEKFIAPEQGFITHKSYKGKEIKVQELPGLWNGAMTNWITVFVEVPLTTFTPVKTVFDLFRFEHRNVLKNKSHLGFIFYKNPKSEQKNMGKQKIIYCWY